MIFVFNKNWTVPVVSSQSTITAVIPVVDSNPKYNKDKINKQTNKENMIQCWMENNTFL